MIERTLYKALTQGIEAISKDQAVLDLLFQFHGLDATEIAAIKAVWAKTPPSVVHGYAPVHSTFPLYSIVLQNEGETQTFLGDDVGTIDDEEDENHGADLKGSFWRHAYQVLIYAEHPDVCLYYYEIAKAILVEAHSEKVFQDEGIHAMRLSGADIAPDARFVPEHLFLRALTVEAEREFQRVDLSSKLGKAFKVSGLHVDKEGSPSDVGGAKTLVKTYTEE